MTGVQTRALPIEVRTENAANIGDMRGHLSSLGLGEVALQEFGAPTDVLIRVQRQEGGEKAQQNAIVKVKSVLGDNISYRRSEERRVGKECRVRLSPLHSKTQRLKVVCLRLLSL